MSKHTPKQFVETLLAATEAKRLTWYYDNRIDTETESYYAAGVGNSEIKLTIDRDTKTIVMYVSKNFSSSTIKFIEDEDNLTPYDDLLDIIDNYSKTTKLSEFFDIIPKLKNQIRGDVIDEDEDEDEVEDVIE